MEHPVHFNLCNEMKADTNVSTMTTWMNRTANSVLHNRNPSIIHCVFCLWRVDDTILSRPNCQLCVQRNWINSILFFAIKKFAIKIDNFINSIHRLNVSFTIKTKMKENRWAVSYAAVQCAKENNKEIEQTTKRCTTIVKMKRIKICF